MTTVATSVWTELEVLDGRTAEFTFALYEDDGTTPLVLASADVIRFKVWLSGSEASAPAIDADSVSNTPAFTVDDGTDVVTSAAHGLSDGDTVELFTTDTLPAGLSTETRYYIITSTTNTFQLSLTSGGSAVDITDTGTGTHTWGSLASYVTISDLGSAGTDPATVVVTLDQNDTDLTVGGSYLGELSVVDASDAARIKPIMRGPISIVATTTSQGDIGLT